MRLLSLLFTVVVSVVAFAQAPTITSLSTYSANVGASVTITGTGFDGATASNNKVYFGGVKASVTSASTTQLTVLVPRTTSTSTVSVMKNGLRSNSKKFLLKNTSSGSLSLSWSSQYFSTPTTVTLSSVATTYAWEPVDVDNDGDMDFVTAGSTGTLQIIVNGGATSSFTMANSNQSSITLNSALAVNEIKSADFNNDGYIDFAVSFTSGRNVEIIKNNGNGTYASQGVITFNNLYSSAYVNSITLEDFNNDGFVDVLASSYGTYSSSAFQIFSQSSTTAFSFSNYYSAPAGASYWFTKRNGAADVNNDGYLDVFVLAGSGTGTQGLNVALGTSTGFNSMTNISGSTDMYGYTDFSFVDFDNDGDLDVACPGQSNMRFYTNNGSGVFTYTSTSNASRFTELFDIDNDSDLDLIGSSYFGIIGSQNVNGSYDPSSDFSGSIQYTGESQLIDLNGDGYLDVAFLKQDGTTMYAMIFQGNPSPPTITSNLANTALTYCQGSTPTALTITASGATSYQWQSSADNSNWTNINGATNSSYTPSTLSASTLYYRCVATNSFGSTNSTATGLFTVNATNTAGTASSNPTLCINTALTSITRTTTGATGIGTASNLPTGVTATWSANTLTVSGTPTASGVFNYSIPLTGGCGSINATGTISVNAANTAGTASSNPTGCINTALTSITRTTTGATGIGTPTSLPAGVTASWSANTLTVSGTPTAAGTFNYSIPLTGGCGSVNATGTITVSNTNTAGTASSTPSVCNGSSMTAVTHTTTGATSIGIPSGLPGGVSVSFASNTITISGSPSKTYAIGNYYNGGVIAYIFQPGDNGYAPGKVLIVDPNYKLTGPITACLGRWDMESPTAVTSTAIGEGMNNTNNLVAAGHTNTGKAIGFVNAYSDGTYSDWFVPSKDELYQVLVNLPTSIFPADGYPIRSSSEIVGSLTQTHAYIRSGSSANLMAQNDGGCANMVIARYDVLPTVTSGNVAYSYSVPLLSGCPTANATGTITVADTYTWTGATSTSATTASNWSPASVPCASATVSIPSGLTNYPSYTTLTIDAGATYTVQAGAQLTVTGTLTNNGTFTIENGGTLVQGASSTLAGSGTYNVKQNITGAGSTTPTGRFWYLGSPVSLSSSSVYFGNAANVVKKRDESTNSWVALSSGTPENLVVGKGYYTQATANSTITFTGGVVNNGAITINGLTRTAGQSFEGFNLVSNPYPSYLNWDAVTRTNVDGTMWYRTNDGSNMVFDTYVANAAGGIGTNLGGTSVTKFIPPMQSFWVRVSQGQTSGSLTLGNAMRSHFNSLGGSTAGLKSTNDEPSLFLRMNLLQAGKKDQLIVYVNETATNGFDALDGEKMMQAGYPQFYTKAADKKIVINGLNSAKKQQALPITMELPTTGVHSFIIEDLEISNGLVWLEDKQEEIIQALEPGTVYEFFANSGMNAERFVLHFNLLDNNTPSAPNFNEVGSAANFNGKGANVHAEAAGVVVIKLLTSTEGATDIQIRDAAGKLVYNGSTSNLQTNVQLAQANGIYYVTLSSKNGVEVRKVFVQQ
ncbi:MAG: hypothetical protein RLZZ65_113 [Bacteroidota bacterium]|jgi:hypothetical protein